MAASTQKPTEAPGTLVISSTLKTVTLVLMLLGLAGFVAALFMDRSRAWHAYLTAYFFFASLAVGGLFFTAIQHATTAGWSVNIRRLSESMTAFLPVAFVGGLVMLFGMNNLYEWMDKAVVSQDPILLHKSGYLNLPFYIFRYLVYFGCWYYFARKIVGMSLKQDENGDESLTLRLTRYGVAFLPFFALTYSFFSVDLFMSIEPHWYSTIFGVYEFSGLFQSALAFLILLTVFCMKKGILKGYVDENHLHDLGKFLFAFTVFWAYIAFSQYMLIWYANLPEETVFFLHRLNGGWVYVCLSLIFVKFIIPFFALLSRKGKRRPNYLASVAVLILIMQYVDNYWVVYPAYNNKEVVFGIPEILIFLGFLGAYLFTTFRFLSKHPVVPRKDPRQFESTHHHVVY